MKRYNVTAIAPNRTLSSGIASGAGSLDLDSAPAGAPATPFQIAVWEEQGDGSYSRSEMEVMEVTDISGATLTIGERGMEGTSARSFSSGALVTIGLWTPSQLEHAIGFETDAGQQSGTYEWDVDSGPQLRLTLTGNTTIDAQNIANGRSARIIAVQDSTGGHSLILGDGFATENAVQPAISTEPGAATAFMGFTSQGAVLLDLQDAIDTSSDVTVETLEATAVDESSATLNGELTLLQNESEADVWFEYRESGQTTWQETTKQQLTSLGLFDFALTGLNNVQHEFRANAEAGGVTDQGDILTFDASSENVYTEDFSGFSVGTTDVSSVFSQPWGTLVTEVVDLNGENALRVRTVSVDTRGALLHDEASADADGEDSSIFVEFIPNPNDFSAVRCLARASGDAGSETGVSSGIIIDNGITIDEYINGEFTRHQEGSFAYSGERVRMLMKVFGSTAELTIWLAGNTQPTAPNITFSSLEAVGNAGLGLFFFNSTDADILHLSIATGQGEVVIP